MTHQCSLPSFAFPLSLTPPPLPLPPTHKLSLSISGKLSLRKRLAQRHTQCQFAPSPAYHTQVFFPTIMELYSALCSSIRFEYSSAPMHALANARMDFASAHKSCLQCELAASWDKTTVHIYIYIYIYFCFCYFPFCLHLYFSFCFHFSAPLKYE